MSLNIFNELNKFRGDPKSYIPLLESIDEAKIHEFQKLKKRQLKQEFKGINQCIQGDLIAKIQLEEPQQPLQYDEDLEYDARVLAFNVQQDNYFNNFEKELICYEEGFNWTPDTNQNVLIQILLNQNNSLKRLLSQNWKYCGLFQTQDKKFVTCIKFSPEIIMKNQNDLIEDDVKITRNYAKTILKGNVKTMIITKLFTLKDGTLIKKIEEKQEQIVFD